MSSIISQLPIRQSYHTPLLLLLLVQCCTTYATTNINNNKLQAIFTPQSIQQQTIWPHLTHAELYAIVGVNLGSFIFSIILLRIIWPPPSAGEIKVQKEMETKINEIQQSYLTFENRKEVIDIYEGKYI